MRNFAVTISNSMKHIKLIAATISVVAIVSACSSENNSSNFPVLNTPADTSHHGAHGEEKATGSFGEKIDESGLMSSADLLKQLETKDSVAAKISAPISHACQKKGCWMMVDLAGTEMRVTFKDYGFFVPKNSAGHTATMQGVASKEILSVETLRHYAEDEGKSKEEIAAITEPITEYSFEAVGVIIK